ncbi:hypothetical protein [Pontimicrobium sp. IMCC45349]|uniref:hypothetical protein n=1 Tax=Pontimicrobium sp. IMCC45349 TaxID=3391574 RepID=UPI0039A126B5
MEEIARYHIDDKFIITGRGLVFTGHIIEGVINIGDYIEFSFNGNLIRRRIIGINAVRNSMHSKGVFDKLNTGVLIKCQSEEEMKMIRISNLKDVEAFVFKD